MRKLRVAVIAPPWLTIPPRGYGGVEAVIDGLVRGLRDIGVDVELFSIKATKLSGIKVHSFYQDEQFKHIHRPMYEVLPIALAHFQFALNAIKKDGKFDIIHDHSWFIGSFISQYVDSAGLPPIIQTLHGPPFSNDQTLREGLPDNKPMWSLLAKTKSLHLVGISESFVNSAPNKLKPCFLPYVHNAINVKQFPFRAAKSPYFITLARFSKVKGQHIAAQLCSELGFRLKMAGTIAAGIENQRQLTLEMANPLSSYRNNPDFRYYSDKILPITAHNSHVSYIGNISGPRKLSVISKAKALLFPIHWEEPFGMAVIEALACGTPVIAMNRGAMPEIIEHGVNGFLANTPVEFKKYMQRIDEIDPRNCRKTVEERFSTELMARNYVARYRTVLKTNNAKQ